MDDWGFPQRLLRAVALVAVFVVLPGAASWAIGGPLGAASLAVGCVVGLIAALSHVPQLAHRLLPLAAVGLVLGGVSQGTWWWVVVVAGFAGITGLSRRWHLAAYFTYIAILAASAKPIDRFTDALLAAVFVIIGALGGYAAARGARRRGVLDLPPARVTGVFNGWTLALAVAATATIAHLLGDDLSHWIPMTVLALALPTAEGRDSHVLNRAVGTLIGLVAVAPLAIYAPSPVVTYPLAVVCVVLAVAVDEPYWLRVALLTLLILLVAGPTTGVVDVAERRLLFTLIGAAVVALFAVVIDRVRLARAL